MEEAASPAEASAAVAAAASSSADNPVCVCLVAQASLRRLVSFCGTNLVCAIRHTKNPASTYQVFGPGA